MTVFSVINMATQKITVRKREVAGKKDLLDDNGSISIA